MAVKPLICPHCHTAVPQTASVCTGCGAEVVRGAARRERGCTGCVVSLVCLVVALAIAGMHSLPPTGSDEGLLLIGKFIAVLIVGNLLGRWLMAFWRRGSLRFIRTYRHD
jgi:hypothetical protein